MRGTCADRVSSNAGHGLRRPSGRSRRSKKRRRSGYVRVLHSICFEYPCTRVFAVQYCNLGLTGHRLWRCRDLHSVCKPRSRRANEALLVRRFSLALPCSVLLLAQRLRRSGELLTCTYASLPQRPTLGSSSGNWGVCAVVPSHTRQSRRASSVSWALPRTPGTRSPPRR